MCNELEQARPAVVLVDHHHHVDDDDDDQADADAAAAAGGIITMSGFALPFAHESIIIAGEEE